MPTVRREGDVGGREDGDEMVFGGTYGTFRREGAMVVGRDVLERKGDRGEVSGEFGRRFIVKE